MSEPKESSDKFILETDSQHLISGSTFSFLVTPMSKKSNLKELASFPPSVKKIILTWAQTDKTIEFMAIGRTRETSGEAVSYHVLIKFVKESGGNHNAPAVSKQGYMKGEVEFLEERFNINTTIIGTGNVDYCSKFSNKVQDFIIVMDDKIVSNDRGLLLSMGRKKDQELADQGSKPTNFATKMEIEETKSSLEKLISESASNISHKFDNQLKELKMKYDSDLLSCKQDMLKQVEDEIKNQNFSTNIAELRNNLSENTKEVEWVKSQVSTLNHNQMNFHAEQINQQNAISAMFGNINTINQDSNRIATIESLVQAMQNNINTEMGFYNSSIASLEFKFNKMKGENVTGFAGLDQKVSDIKSLHNNLEHRFTTALSSFDMNFKQLQDKIDNLGVATDKKLETLDIQNNHNFQTFKNTMDTNFQVSINNMNAALTSNFTNFKTENQNSLTGLGQKISDLRTYFTNASNQFDLWKFNVDSQEVLVKGRVSEMEEKFKEQEEKLKELEMTFKLRFLS